MKFEQPDPFKQTIARTFTYTSSAFLIGAMFYLFTNNLIAITIRPDWIGTAVLIGYAVVFGNLTYLLTRRYMRKPYTFEVFSYFIGLIVAFPTFFLIRLKGDLFPAMQDEIIFVVVVLAGVALGCWKGRQKGQELFLALQQKKEHPDQQLS